MHAPGSSLCRQNLFHSHREMYCVQQVEFLPTAKREYCWEHPEGAGRGQAMVGTRGDGGHSHRRMQPLRKLSLLLCHLCIFAVCVLELQFRKNMGGSYGDTQSQIASGAWNLGFIV